MNIRSQDEKLMSLLKECNIRIGDKEVPLRWYKAKTIDDITDINIDASNILKKNTILPQITAHAGNIKLRRVADSIGHSLSFRRNFFVTVWSTYQTDIGTIIDTIVANYNSFRANGFSIERISSLKDVYCPTAVFKLKYSEIKY